MAHENAKRKYELKKRADAMADTRLRITEAAMELHGSVGPARTTVSAVADRAGVQRHTVYRHFPTEDDLFTACSVHWAAMNPWPDPEPWRSIDDPGARLRTALDAVYRWYERIEPMMANLLRDRDLVETIGPHMEPMERYRHEAQRILTVGWPARGARKRVLAAAVRHALDFQTWRSLVRDGGISRAQAVKLAAALVESAGR
jgi:AcrR family transcriptional regulator